MARNKHQIQVKRMDTKFSRLMRLDKPYCERCGTTTKQLHAHHYFGRTNMYLRYDPDNIFILCANCHKFSPDSAHEDPEAFRNFALDKRGEWWLDNLLMLKNQIKPDYDGIEKKINEELKNIED